MAEQFKKINYQEVLRDIAKSMVRLRRPERLLKVITRFIDRELHLTHTAIAILREDRKHFTFVDSKGSRRVPVGLIKFEEDHAFVRWFRRMHRTAGSEKREFISRSQVESRLRRLSPENPEVEELQSVVRSMIAHKVDLVVPGYFKKTLLGLLLLGSKKDKSPFSSAEIDFFQVLAQDCSMAVKTAEYHRDLIRQNQELGQRLEEIETLRKKEQKTYYEIMRSLAQEVYAKDPYTFGHVGQVERLGLMTAREMGLDLSGKKKAILSAGLILHDVGKIGIPDGVLNKPARLDEREWKIMKTHVDKGVKILEPLTDFREVADIVRCHHENFDGTGYPRGLKGDDIPMGSRIVAVVDAFHAIVSTRCYSQGRPLIAAFDELRRCSGTQFDPAVVEAFISAMNKELKKRGREFYLEDNVESLTGEDKKLAS